ncbi:BTAD domain-containing putative transcriptional regulator [Actinoallomurus rhizosphaericola]|uniref:BTAD domain-containing putative transcriptional regulator n=1 Tax=Actinoallomurus rhizosphaericola TaxID=2952536 RepID=UPI002090A505|nr:BTAD domain-containing putative transcriptional regulator [Actinoallomurus rhizosphaericola]MCO5994335.1 AAA family ATPase [Actinoallomurus rhizosphaericola]
MSDHLRFVLLGPLEVWSGDVRLDLGPPKRRVLLARLLIADSRPVSADRLGEDLWEGSPPAGAMSSIHSHISRLRAVLEPDRTRRGGQTVLLSGSAGYTLNAPPQARDSTRFEEAVNHARGLLTRGRLAEARREVQRGLTLWRGTALADAANYAFAEREIARLEEIRLAAGELHATVLLHEGAPDEAAVIAEELTTRSPLREAAWALLLRALYLAGRPAEALRRFEAIRTLLAEELGTVPGPELSDVHVAVLRQDLTALAPFRSHTTPVPLVGRPAGATSSIVGRAAELTRFDEILSDASEGRTRWVVLSGEGGIGKTRLAEEFASRAADAGFKTVWVRCGIDIGGEADGGDGPDPIGRLISMAYPDIRLEGGSEAIAGELTERLTRQPTICLIEDLHRAGPRFRRLLGSYAAVLRDVALIVVCTTQDTDDAGLRELLALLVRQTRATLMPLDPLTVADVHELMQSRSTPFNPSVPGSELHQREAAALHRRGEGNPFLITEILELPSEERTGPGARLPASISRVLRARMDLLDDRVLTMLQAIAVTGGELDPELLLRIRTISREELLSLIDAAVTARVLNWEDGIAPGRTGRYIMPDLVRELVLQDLTPARRQLLHAAAARALTELQHRHPVHIARHLMAAGPLIAREDLIDAAFAAGNRCAEDDQHAEAALWFDHAAALADDPGVRAEARHAADTARLQLDQLERWIGHPGDPADPAWPTDHEPRAG